MMPANASRAVHNKHSYQICGHGSFRIKFLVVRSTKIGYKPKSALCVCDISKAPVIFVIRPYLF